MSYMTYTLYWLLNLVEKHRICDFCLRVHVKWIRIKNLDLSNILWRACNLTAFTHSSTGPVVHLFASRPEGSIPGGYLCETGIPVSIVSLHWGPRHDWSLWPRLRRALSRTVTRSLCQQCDLTQLFCPGFTLAAGLPSNFTTDIVACWGGALWRACNLTAFTHSSTGQVVQLFASHHEGPRFNPQGGTYVKPGFSC